MSSFRVKPPPPPSPPPPFAVLRGSRSSSPPVNTPLSPAFINLAVSFTAQVGQYHAFAGTLRKGGLRQPMWCPAPHRSHNSSESELLELLQTVHAASSSAARLRKSTDECRPQKLCCNTPDLYSISTISQPSSLQHKTWKETEQAPL